MQAVGGPKRRSARAARSAATRTNAPVNAVHTRGSWGVRVSRRASLRQGDQEGDVVAVGAQADGELGDFERASLLLIEGIGEMSGQAGEGVGCFAGVSVPRVRSVRGLVGSQHECRRTACAVGGEVAVSNPQADELGERRSGVTKATGSGGPTGVAP